MIKAESLIIGAIATDPQAIMGIVLKNGVTEDWFVDPAMREVWKFMVKSEPKDCALFNLMDRWSESVETAIEGGVENSIPSHIEHYISVVRKEWQKRTVHRIGKELSSGDHEFEDVSRKLVEIHSAFTESEFETPVEVANKVISDVRAVMAGKKTTGLHSAFGVVNRDWGGYQNGKLYVIGARPSVGKSTFLRQEALHMVNNDLKVGMCALEMDEGEIRRLMACNWLYLNEFELRNGRVGAKDVEYWEKEMLRQARQPIFINDDGGQSADQIRAWAIQKKARDGLDVLVVDYLQQMSHDGRSGVREGVGKSCNALRLLAKDMDIPVILASQLSRASEESERPQLHHLKETGNIEADAYGVMLIHRPGFKGSPDHEFINAKNRGGVVGTIQEMMMENKSYTFAEKARY